jgi:hypothetical protein
LLIFFSLLLLVSPTEGIVRYVFPVTVLVFKVPVTSVAGVYPKTTGYVTFFGVIVLL